MGLVTSKVTVDAIWHLHILQHINAVQFKMTTESFALWNLHLVVSVEYLIFKQNLREIFFGGGGGFFIH